MLRGQGLWSRKRPSEKRLRPDSEVTGGSRCARVAVFGDTVGPKAHQRAEVYAESRLSLWTWTGKDGDAKSGLNLAAWEMHPMGQNRKAEAQGPIAR